MPFLTKALIEHRTARDLIPVVIFAIDPEDRNDVGLMIVSGPAGELDGGDGLQQREERAAEDPRLLPGQNRDRSGVGEFLRGLARGYGGPAAGLLCGDRALPIQYLTVRYRYPTVSCNKYC